MSYQLISSKYIDAYISFKETFKMYADFIISMGMFTRRDENGNIKTKDVFIGLEMVGKATYDAEVQLAIGYVMKIYHLQGI